MRWDRCGGWTRSKTSTACLGNSRFESRNESAAELRVRAVPATGPRTGSIQVPREALGGATCQECIGVTPVDRTVRLTERPVRLASEPHSGGVLSRRLSANKPMVDQRVLPVRLAGVATGIHVLDFSLA